MIYTSLSVLLYFYWQVLGKKFPKRALFLPLLSTIPLYIVLVIVGKLELHFSNKIFQLKVCLKRDCTFSKKLGQLSILNETILFNFKFFESLHSETNSEKREKWEPKKMQVMDRNSQWAISINFFCLVISVKEINTSISWR